jgi:MFS transporter, DHA1 family, tetracycline resistance protein
MPSDLRRVTRRFVLLTALRWAPVGLTIPVTVLYALDRGLTLAEFGLATAVQGLLVLVLELPTGSLADSWGRRPVLILAAAFQAIALVTLILAGTPAVFAIAYALMGVFRALDSGALEAWFADAALAIDPSARLERGLGAAATAIGTSIGSAALVSSCVILVAPSIGADPLLLPIVVAAALAAGQLACVTVLLPEIRAPHAGATFRSAVREVPRTLLSGFRLLRDSRVLVALVSVEIFWGFGMYAFETLTPVKLSDVVDDADAAATLMGPVAAVGWLVFALGSFLAERASRRIDVAVVALVLRVIQGAFVVAMGLAAGPIGVIVAYLGCYAAHGGSGPLHNTLLHREASPHNRATVLSMNSMIAQPAGSAGAIVLGAVATDSSIGMATAIGGVALALAAPLYLPAVSRRRRR